jgi:hypothetical protein
MPLEPVGAHPGLWVNTDCPPGGPGVYALIIGVSRYDHLSEGRDPALETYGLGQLSVSALTAYRFFSWLGNSYALDGWPVARVRLLMSPLRKGMGNITADELEKCDPEICAHAPEATFDNCKDAIETWYAEMQRLPAGPTGRSLFFFSGHGMELRQNYQVLLPSNYLRPPNQPRDEAISTRNLIDCLPYLARVSSHVLLLDGCRNDVDKLRGRNVKGATILNEELPDAINPMFEKAVVYSTASGLRAYSPKAGGLSLFGQALLDGLSTEPDPVLDEAPIELNRKGNVYTIEVNKLAGYMKRRVAALIKAANESVVQVVRAEVASSNPDQPIEIAAIPLAPTGADDHLLVEEVEIDALFEESAELPREARHEFPKPPKPPDPDAWFRERYEPAQEVAALLPPAADRWQQVDRLHGILGSEAITFPWLDSLRVTGLLTRDSADHTAVEILSSAQAPKTAELHRVQIYFRLAAEDPVGHVMTIMDNQGRRFCCVLPADKDKRTFQLEIDIERGAFIRVATYLSPRNEGPTGLVARAWEQMRARDPRAAAQQLDSTGTTAKLEEAFRQGEQVLTEKLRAPLAAAVASVLLLKGNRFDRMHDWARNVGNWFPWIPDGVVLWTEQRRRMAAGQPLEPDLIPWFVRELSRRSLPFTADGFGLAADIVSDIVRGRLKTDDVTRDAARSLDARIDAALPYFRDTGLFCTFAGWPDDWDPAAVLGPPIA